MFTEQVDNLDKLLDELEDLARSDLPTARFFVTLVERLQLTLAAHSTVLLLPLAGGDWLPIASSGTPSPTIQAELTSRLKDLCSDRSNRRGDLRGDAPEVLMGSADGEHWFATPIRPHNFNKGCLLTCLTGAIPPNSMTGLVELQTAFAEVVAIRQQAELETFLDDTWEKTQALCLQINTTKSYDEAASLLANELARVIEAARVTVMSVGASGQPVVQAVSGVPKANPRSATLQALQAVGEEVARSGKPVMRQQPYVRGADGQPLPELAANGSFSNLIGVRLSARDNRAEKPAQLASATVLAIEYQTYPEMVRCATKFPHLLPTIAVAWDQHTRWLRLPRAARLLAWGPKLSLRAVSPLLKWSVLLALFLLALWGLHQPYPLVIEAEGAYEPVTSRAIYASDDGFIEELLVDDATFVKSGQPLVRLRSPTLELRIEQIQGEARAVQEEASGIRIAINQLATDTADVLSQQSRLAGKVAELETRKQSLGEQLQLLEAQRERLLLVAPIEGYVVAKDLRRNLAGRPVRRGDSLFSIVDQAGPWHVRVQVADRDVGYLLEHYAPQQASQIFVASSDIEDSSAPRDQPLRSEIDFCLASDPDERYEAQLTWIADHVENRHGEGCSLEVRGIVGPQSPVGAHAGAGVHAFFECGQQPLWFVWCRPLVEAAQRRLWFRSQESE